MTRKFPLFELTAFTQGGRAPASAGREQARIRPGISTAAICALSRIGISLLETEGTLSSEDNLPAPRNSVVSTAQTDKKKACAEKMNNSWMCSATSAPNSEFRKTTPCVLFVS